MSSHKPEHDDELSQLIRQTLENHVGQSEPADDVWERIKAGLVTEKLSRPGHSGGMSLWPLLQTIALVILLTVVGSFWLRFPTTSDQDELILVADTPYALAQANTDILFDEYDVTNKRLLNRPQLGRQQARSSANPGFDGLNSPAVIVPHDLVPHPLSPAGRLLNSHTPGMDRNILKQFGSFIK